MGADRTGGSGGSDGSGGGIGVPTAGGSHGCTSRQRSLLIGAVTGEIDPVERHPSSVGGKLGLGREASAAAEADVVSGATSRGGASPPLG